MSRSSLCAALLGLLLVTACGASATPHHPSSNRPDIEPTAYTPSAPSTGSTPVTGARHKLLVIMLENHSRSEALGQMPHLAGWAARYGQATDYYAVAHPSLPNYLAIWGGGTFGVSSDCSVGTSGCVPPPPSVFSQTLSAGRTARVYQESMTSNCQRTSGTSYAARHSPWPYWTGPRETALCRAHDVPSGTLARGPLAHDIATGALPVTGELTPDFCHDGHDCSLGAADAWLSRWVPKLMAGRDYRSGHLTIVVTFDEDDSSQANKVAFVVIDPRLHHRVVTRRFDHYSLTRWLDDNAGVPRLRNARTAPSVQRAFGL